MCLFVVLLVTIVTSGLLCRLNPCKVRSSEFGTQQIFIKCYLANLPIKADSCHFRGLELLRFYCAITLTFHFIDGKCKFQKKNDALWKESVSWNHGIYHIVILIVYLRVCLPSRLTATWAYGSSYFYILIPTSVPGTW